MHDLLVYVRLLRQSRIGWMDGREGGMAVRAGTNARAKYPILLWPGKFESTDEFLTFVTHEVVHYAHPELETGNDSWNEGAVEAITQGLMKQDVWKYSALYKLNDSMLVAFKKFIRRDRGLV